MKPVTLQKQSVGKSRYTSKRFLMLSTIGIGLLISAAAFFLVVQPQWNRVGAGKELDTEALLATLRERQAYLTQLKALRANYEKISSDDIVLLSRMLPTSKGIPELLTQIEAIGQQSGLQVTAIDVSEQAETKATAKQQLQAEVSQATKQAQKSIKTLNIQVQITTNKYSRFKQFLDAVQTNDRLLDVDSYLFSTDQEVQSLTIKAYYLQT